ncbi:MAG: hypothetical protein B6241_00050 [Spirochaetaceae bacterium 4572_59]|nr:MAG: hypothetical protein B6241_00050 [Spirochaetaceae bacterium 4572_59]
MRKKTLFLLTVFFMAFSLFCDSSEDLLDEIDRAVKAEFYNRAISLANKGGKLYPEDSRFPLTEGDLYASRKLYNLALSSYEKAETLNRSDRKIREEIASVLGLLDRNEEALLYLEGLAEEIDDYRILDDLGWAYFKTHQPEKGIPLLEKAIEREFHKSLALTLGTLYSEVNNVVLCRKSYLASIDAALKDGDSYFASVAYYNLSLAEQSFYSYEKAIEYAGLSLEQMERAGGHLALGDLYLTKGDYPAAAQEIRKAAPLDQTPLSSMNLASLFCLQGKLDAALYEADAIRNLSDDSWMYYFGIDSQQFDTDLNELYRDIYKGLYHRERLTAVRGFIGKFKHLSRVAVYYFRYRYYDSQFRFLAYGLGRTQWKRSSSLRGALTLASAAQGFRQPAEKYLLKARELEAGDPLSVPWYDLEIGRETRNLSLLLRGLNSFQKTWEARAVEDSYREILFLRKGGLKTPESIEASVSVFRQNSGGLRQYGLKLPLHLTMSGSDLSREKRIFSRYISSNGFYLTESFTGSEPYLRLHKVSDKFYSYTISWPDGSILTSGRIHAQKSMGQTAYELSVSLAESVFP